MLFDTTVTLCIILNTAFLAVEHHGMSEDLKHVLDIGNKVIIEPFVIYLLMDVVTIFCKNMTNNTLYQNISFSGLHNIFHC